MNITLNTGILEKWEILPLLSRILGIRMFASNGKKIYKASALSKFKILFICTASIYFYFETLFEDFVLMNAKVAMLTSKFYIFAQLIRFIVALIKTGFINPSFPIDLLKKLNKIEKYIDNNFFTENLKFIYRIVIILFLTFYSLTLIYYPKSLHSTSYYLWQFVELLVNEILMLKCICSTVLIIFYISSINEQLIFQMGLDRNCFMSPFWSLIGKNNIGLKKYTDEISPWLVKKIMKIYIELFDCIELICSMNDVIVSFAFIIKYF